MQYPKITFFGLETNKNLLFSSYTWHTNYRFINRSVERAIGKVGIRAMYSIQKAAALLGKSEMTLRRWMKRFGLKMVVVETDRRRVYIADDDMDILADHIHHNVIKNDAKTKHKTRRNNREQRQVIMIG